MRFQIWLHSGYSKLGGTSSPRRRKRKGQESEKTEEGKLQGKQVEQAGRGRGPAETQAGWVTGAGWGKERQPPQASSQLLNCPLLWGRQGEGNRSGAQWRPPSITQPWGYLRRQTPDFTQIPLMLKCIRHCVRGLPHTPYLWLPSAPSFQRRALSMGGTQGQWPGVLLWIQGPSQGLPNPVKTLRALWPHHQHSRCEGRRW